VNLINSATEQLNNLLAVTHSTIKEMLIYPIGNCSQLQIPSMTQVKRLNLYINEGNRLLPPHLDVNEIFPNLEIVSLLPSLYQNVDDILPSPSIDSWKFLSVTTLEIFNFFSTGLLRRVTTYFPNLRALKLENVVNSGTMKDIFEIWKGSQLERLSIRTCSNENEDYKLKWVSALTGIPEEGCKRLRNSFYAHKDVEKLRGQTSILNLTGKQ